MYYDMNVLLETRQQVAGFGCHVQRVGLLVMVYDTQNTRPSKESIHNSALGSTPPYPEIDPGLVNAL